MTQLALPIGQAATLRELMAVAVRLGARSVEGWSEEESRIAAELPEADEDVAAAAVESIANGSDPLGDGFCRVLSAEERRPKGAVYTPPVIVDAMLSWAATQCRCPAQVIDPGAGSARFLVAAGRRWPAANLVAVENDPVAAILARGHLAAAGFGERAAVILRDFRDLPESQRDGQTLFVGNPPYVRHHLIEPRWKSWFVTTARRLGLHASQLAGLHVHFFLATAMYARGGDVGIFVTAAEWLDVNYGKIVRDLLLGPLGLQSVQIVEPTAEPFPGTATTAVITGFQVGSRPSHVHLRRVRALADLSGRTTADSVRRKRLENTHRWTPLTLTSAEKRDGFVELGELCRVHRGQVTGANRIWIAGPHTSGLPTSVLFKSVTRARDLFGASDCLLTNEVPLRHVVDLPVDLDVFDIETRRQIERFLTYARSAGADSGYIARNRKAWWSVGLREPAPILATYMARRPPAFVRNAAGARHINIAHGLYPRDPLSEEVLRALADYLSRSTQLAEGRTYSGGLTKFEPREMERLLVPHPDVLNDFARNTGQAV